MNFEQRPRYDCLIFIDNIKMFRLVFTVIKSLLKQAWTHLGHSGMEQLHGK